MPYRVRVVEEPISPYLQWELNSLRLRAECGERIRVVTPDAIRSLERTVPLPELLTVGGRTLYRIRYGEQGTLAGAVRYLDPGLVARCEEVMRDLYAAGEEMSSYFNRAVAHLPPPAPEQKRSR